MIEYLQRSAKQNTHGRPQRLVSYSRNLSVDTSTADRLEELDDLNLSTEAAPDASHLEANDTSANDNHLLRDLLELESAGGADDLSLVNLDTGEGSDLGASGDDDVLGLDLGLAALVKGDLDGSGADKAALTLEVVDLVLLEEALDTLGEASYGVGLCLEHGLEVERDLADIDTTRLEVVLSLVVEVGVVEHGLGRNAADVEASASKSASLLNAGSLGRIWIGEESENGGRLYKEG